MNLAVKDDESNVMTQLTSMQKACKALMQTPHYAKIGSEGIFAIMQKAKSLKVDPFDALNGGLYHIKGKVEMTSQMMNQLIRQEGHSITKDKRSNDEICILHGKRKDNGDTWTEYFSIEDAKKAGILGGTYQKYPRDMLFARALSKLARQLFPDVIKGCYVEGEIRNAPPLDHVGKYETPQSCSVETPVEVITEAQFIEINDLIGEDEAYRSKVEKYLEMLNISGLKNLPLSLYERVKDGAVRNQEKRLERDQAIEKDAFIEEEISEETEELAQGELL